MNSENNMTSEVEKAKVILLVSLIVLALALYDHPGRIIFVTLFVIYGIIVIIIKGVVVEALIIATQLIILCCSIGFVGIKIANFIKRKKQVNIVEDDNLNR